MELTEKELAEVKIVAHDLLETLKQEKLVIDWRKKQQSRASVKVTIEKTLDHLPDVFSIDMYRERWSGCTSTSTTRTSGRDGVCTQRRSVRDSRPGRSSRWNTSDTARYQ